MVNISVVIAQALGIIFTVIGISMITKRKNAAAAIEEMTRNQGSLWLWGLGALIIGAVLIVSNNAWDSGLQSLITIIGLLALIKGAFIIIFTDFAVSFYRKLNNDGILIFGGAVVFILGLLLLYKGFM